jgi:hypothetical protein
MILPSRFREGFLQSATFEAAFAIRSAAATPCPLPWACFAAGGNPCGFFMQREGRMRQVFLLRVNDDRTAFLYEFNGSSALIRLTRAETEMLLHEFESETDFVEFQEARICLLNVAAIREIQKTLGICRG